MISEIFEQREQEIALLILFTEWCTSCCKLMDNEAQNKNMQSICSLLLHYCICYAFLYWPFALIAIKLQINCLSKGKLFVCFLLGLNGKPSQASLLVASASYWEFSSNRWHSFITKYIYSMKWEISYKNGNVTNLLM